MSQSLNVCVAWFFFSSRRRHTRSKRDWSSDVCSSDLSPWQASKDPSSGQRSRREPRHVDGRAREGSQIGRRANQPSGPTIVRFVSVLAKRLRTLPPLPLSLPSDDDWLLKIIAIQDQFVLGMYRRQMKAISYLGKIEKRLGVPVTTRSWNTIEKIGKILEANR